MKKFCEKTSKGGSLRQAARKVSSKALSFCCFLNITHSRKDESGHKRAEKDESWQNRQDGNPRGEGKTAKEARRTC